jgi:endonuclease/exonuclease/phosphatase family metal-dependent hydrolase
MHPDDRSDEPRDPFIERLAARLREPVSLSPEVERVVLDRLRARPIRRRWPAVAAALAAGIAAAFAAGLLVGRWTVAPPGVAPSVRPIEFALRTAADSAVVLVGDFNDWNPAATPLHRASDGVWSVTVSLRPGRYRYTFIVDGTRWRRDPAAPPALEDDFGAPTSVITIAQR